MEPMFRYKLILFGNVTVGKTSIIERYVNDRFQNEYISTLGYNVFEKIVKINEDSLSFVIFDIGGQEQFEELRKKYAAGANVALLVYDITNRETFNNIRNWHRDLENFTNNATFVLIGNKVDLEDMRQVQKNEGIDLAKELNAVGFFETSAKTNEEIENVFIELAHKLFEKNKT